MRQQRIIKFRNRKTGEIQTFSVRLIDSSLFGSQNRERYYWTNIPLGQLPDESPLVLKDIMENSVDKKYFYKKDFEILDMKKRVCAELKVNTTEMCKRIFNPDFKMSTLTCVSGGYQEKKVLDGGRPRKLTEVSQMDMVMCTHFLRVV